MFLSHEGDTPEGGEDLRIPSPGLPTDGEGVAVHVNPSPGSAPTVHGILSAPTDINMIDLPRAGGVAFAPQLSEIPK